jgi:hypothetical protein
MPANRLATSFRLLSFRMCSPPSAFRTHGSGAGEVTRIDEMAAREFTPLRMPAHSEQAVIQLESHHHPAGLLADPPVLLHGADDSRTDRGAEADSPQSLGHLGARSEEGDHEERHDSDQNVDNAAHHDPANSSYRCPFRP